MKKEIVLVGGGGHCKSVIDVIEEEGTFSIVGIIDVKQKLGQHILNYEICWTDDQIPELVKKYDNFLVTVGQIQDPGSRILLYDKIKAQGGTLPVIVSPKAHVSRHAKIEEGTVVMHNVVVNADALVGKNSILNSGCLLEHDVKVGDHCHISTKAVINGGTIISDRVFVGCSAVLAQMINVGKDSIVSSGSVVRKNVPEYSLAFGHPAITKTLVSEK